MPPCFVRAPLFFDVDAGLETKKWESSYGKTTGAPDMLEVHSQRYSVFAAATANYTLYKGLSVGAGLAPSYYFYQDGEDNKRHFDVPLIAKVAYNFKIFELGVSYKYGLTNSLKTDYLKSGRLQEWNLSLWIPF